MVLRSTEADLQYGSKDKNSTGGDREKDVVFVTFLPLQDLKAPDFSSEVPHSCCSQHLD